MNKNIKETPSKLPVFWISIISAIIIVLLLWYIFNLKTDIKIDRSKQQEKTIVKQIDSLKLKRNEEFQNVIKTSQANAVSAKKLIKPLSNEKTTIRDTSNAAMRRYLTNYKSE